MMTSHTNLCQEDVSYESYLMAFTAQEDQIVAWSLPSGLASFVKEVKSVLKELSVSVGESFEVLLTAFKSKDLFNLFKAAGFSIKKILKAITALLSLPFHALMAAFEDLSDTAIFKAIKSGAMKVDEFLEKHPVLRRLSGPAIAGLLVWMWLNSSYIGDPVFDLDLSYIAAAFAGRFSIEELFASPEGLAALSVLGLGFTGIGIYWIGSAASDVSNLVLALLFTGAKRAKNNGLAQSLKKLIKPTHVRAHLMKIVPTSKTPVVANGLDALRASKLLEHLGIRGFELQESTTSVLVFGVHGFQSCVAPLTKFYGTPKNESNAGWQTKRLVWPVPEVNGQVMLMQVANMTPLLMFRQL